MKKFIATVSTAALITAALSGTVSAADKSFTDINNSYAKDAIIELQAMGILDGIDATHFAPKGTLTRAQFVTIIVRTLGLDATATTSQFTDVKGWSVPYVEAAAAAGIIEGTGNGMFSPNATLTREEAATILVRALDLVGELEDYTVLNFTDAAQISDWAKPYIAVAVKYGLVQGNPDGTFNPKGSANREMAATMGMNLLSALEKVTPDQPEPTPTPTPTPEPTPEPTPTPTPAPPVYTGGGGYYNPTVYVTAIDVTAASKTITKKGGTLQLSATVTPSNATDASVTWSVSNNNATIDADGLLTAKKDGTVKVTATAKDGSDVSGSLTITISGQTMVTPPPVDEADTVKPVITLKGDATVNVANGAEYTDAGATASDNKDGDISGKIAVTITNASGDEIDAIDTSVAGEYVYNYNVKDAAGNVAAEVTRTVTVKEAVVTPPVKADLTAYNAALAAITETDYTEESWAAYQAVVVANAVTVDNTQAEVDAATAAIIAAQANLVAKPIADTTAPSISLIGDSVVTAVYGAAYTDAGAMALDDRDGDISGNIVITITDANGGAVNVVDTNAASATYTYHYNVSDAAGNMANEVTRTVIVGEKPTPPPTVVNNVYIESNNVVDSTYATVGDTITLTFNTYEEVTALSNFKIDGNNPDDFTSTQTGDTWMNTATYTVQNSDPEGLVNFQINVQNAAGIYSVTTEETTNGSTVTVLNAPVISNVSISTNNVVDSTYAMTGDTVTLSFETTQPVWKLGNFKINGNNVNSFDSVQAGDKWVNTATYVLDGTDPAGPLTFQINVKNVIGLYSITTEQTTDGSAVNVVYPVSAEDFGKIAPDVVNDVYGSYNVGFKINLDYIDYDSIASMTGTIYDGDTVVSQVYADTPERIAKYKLADSQLGGLDGQLSFDFVTQDALDDAGIPDGQSSYLNYAMPVSDDYMTGTKLPTSATVEIVTKNGLVITIRYTYPQ